MSVSISLHDVRKIVLGVPRVFTEQSGRVKTFVWQSVTFHKTDGESVTVDCCLTDASIIPVECRNSERLLDALNHHTAVLLREMVQQIDSATETEGAALQKTP